MKKSLFILFIFCCSFNYPDNFVKMMRYILKFEGGFTMIDPGGTNYGIRQANYDTYRISRKLPKQNVRFISQDEVYDLYWNNYYLRSGSDTLLSPLSLIHYDTAINCGTSQATKFVKKVNLKTPKESALKYVDLRDQLYLWLAKNKGKQAFLNGWLSRNNQIREIIINEF